jgi:1,4-dihydroxy-2-naphthoate octaprenyltransferase
MSSTAPPSPVHSSLTPAAPSRVRVWLQAIRVFSFTASVIPILVGSALAFADHAFRPGLTALILLASITCHAGANLANDYYDHRKGIDTDESLGPSQVIQDNLLSPREVRRGMIVAFALATLLGLIIVSTSGWPVFALAVACLAAAYFYTGGPAPLGYMALGEVTVFLSMGIGIIVGAYYVLTASVTVASFLAASAIAFLVALILHANNIRDIALDRAAGKRTLATILGRSAANIEYALLVAASYVSIVALVVFNPSLWPASLVLLTLPLAMRLTQVVFVATDPSALNSLLRRTAGLHLRFGLLLAIGLACSAVLP